MDDLAWLTLQLEWGADEALEGEPVDRRATSPAASAPIQPRPVVVARAAPAPVIGLAGVAHAQALAQAALDLPALRAALEGFEECALRATATNLVFAKGNPAARLVLVADIPGAAEDRAGIPFAGPAGLFLDRMFASAGLDRAETYATSLLPWRPPGDRKPTEMEVQLCLPFLYRHLQLVGPRRLILLGGLAARTFLPVTGRRARGAWHELPIPGLADLVPTLVLPTAAHIQATPACKRDVWADLLRLRRILDTEAADHN